MSWCQHVNMPPSNHEDLQLLERLQPPLVWEVRLNTERFPNMVWPQLPSQRFTEPCNACCIDLQLFKIVVINWGMHRVHKPWRTNLELKGIIAELWYRVKIMSLSNIGPSPKVFLCWWRQQNIVSSYSETNNCVRTRCIKNFKGWIAGFIPLCGLLEQKPSWQLCKTRQQ